MGICCSTICSAAKNGCLGSQACNCGCDEITFPSALTTNNGCVSSTFAPYTSRNVIIRRNSSTEEERRITSQVSGCRYSVDHDWCMVPAACDNFHVSYHLADLNDPCSCMACNWAAVSKSNRTGTIASGGNVSNITSCGYLVVSDQFYFQGRCGCCTGNECWCVTGCGILGSGFLTSDGVGVSGGFFIRPRCDGSPCASPTWIQTTSGQSGRFKLRGSYESGSAQAKFIHFNPSMCCRPIEIISNTFGTATDTFRASGGACLTFNKNVFVGDGASTSTVAVEQLSNIDGNIFFNTQGYIFCGSSGTLTINHQFFFNPQRSALVALNQKFNFDDSTGLVGNACQLCIANCQATGFVNRRFTSKSTISDTCGCTICGAKVYVGQHTCGDTMVNDCSTSSGIANQKVVRNKYSKCMTTFTTETFGEFDLHWVDYDKVPQQRTLPIENDQEFPIVLIDDSRTCATEACAVANGFIKPSICIDTACPHSIIKFTGGSCGLDIGDVITASGASPAIGVVKDIIEGCTMCGSIVLNNRNGQTYDNCETLMCGSCTWTANYTMCSEQRFSYLYCVGNKTFCCGNRTVQQGYDHMGAKLAQCPIDTTSLWDDVIIWGEDEHTFFMIPCGTTKFKTVRNVNNTDGWVLTGLDNLGSIGSYTDIQGSYSLAYLFALLALAILME